MTRFGHTEAARHPAAPSSSNFDAVGATGATAKPGSYVIADDTTNRLIGTLTLDRRAADRPGHLSQGGEELELSYVLRRRAWGMGLAFEAATAALHAMLSDSSSAVSVASNAKHDGFQPIDPGSQIRQCLRLSPLAGVGSAPAVLDVTPNQRRRAHLFDGSLITHPVQQRFRQPRDFVTIGSDSTSVSQRPSWSPSEVSVLS
jgi:Acetyltransferase (GNAT) domain